MEIPGDRFKPYLGMVNQYTYAPMFRLVPFKMTRCTLDVAPDKGDTPNNAVPDYMTNMRFKRRASGVIHQVCLDDNFNLFGTNPYGEFVSIYDGILIRALFKYDTSISAPAGLTGERVGVPLIGSASELPTLVAPEDYVFMAIRITRVRHEADAGAGQPYDLEWESAYAFSFANENRLPLLQYGWNPAIADGGFL